MSTARIPHDAFIFVGDGRKGLILRNAGDATRPNLKTLEVFTNENGAPTHDVGTDRPGRTFNSVGSRRSALEQTDWHEREEQAFARRCATKLEELARNEKSPKLVIVAPPRTLAVLRASFSALLKTHVIAEVAKDLTRHAVFDIEHVLFEAKSVARSIQ